MTIGALTCALAALLASVCPAQSTASSRIVGIVLDSASGRPIVGAFVTAQSAIGRRRTDAHGHFLIAPVAVGIQGFELNCPSRTLLGLPLLSKRIRVAPGDSLVIDVRVDSTLCSEPPYREVTGEFRGFWATGFEESAFSMCADSTLGIPQRDQFGGSDDWSDLVAWVTLTDRAAAEWRQLEAARRGKSSEVPYVRWHGTLKGPGIYGHMGVSAYEMRVDHVQYIGTGDSRVCRSPPDSTR